MSENVNNEMIKSNPFLKKIKIPNFRNFLNFELEFNSPITAIVGPNGSGKTNLLESISYIFNGSEINPDDGCYFNENQDQKVSFEFHLDSSIIDLQKIDLIEFIVEKSETNIINEKEIHEILKKDKPENEKVDELNVKDKLINGIIYYSKPSPAHIHIKIPPIIQQNLSLSGTITIQTNNSHTFKKIKKTDWDGILQLNKPLIDQHGIRCEIISENELISTDLLEVIKHKLKVIFWNYNDSYYFEDIIPLNELQTNPDKHKTTLNMFRVSNIDVDKFLLTGQTRQKNFLKKINSKISHLIKQTWPDANIKMELSFGPSNNLMVHLTEHDQDIEPGRRSEGFKWYFAFILYFNAEFGSQIENCIILLDETGIHLHPGAQKSLLKEFEKLSKKNQIIYSTHSPFMLNRLYPKRIVCLNKTKGISSALRTDSHTVDDQLLANILGFPFASIPGWGDFTVLVEGISDYKLLDCIIRRMVEFKNEIILDLNEIKILPIGGLNNLKYYYKAAQNTKSKYIFFLDGDQAAHSKVDKTEKDMEKKGKFFMFLDENKEIEDYIELSELNSSLNRLKEDDNLLSDGFFKDKIFSEGHIGNQIKILVDEYHKFLKDKDNGEIEKGFKEEFKLDLKNSLMEEICNSINESNINRYTNLIEKIKLLNTKVIELMES